MRGKLAQEELNIGKWVLFALVAGLILYFGYKGILLVGEKNCQAELVLFKNEFKATVQELYAQPGSAKKMQYPVPCNSQYFIFANLDHGFNLNALQAFPLVRNSISGGIKKNMFLVRGSEIIDSDYVEELTVNDPFILCLTPRQGKIHFYLRGQAPETAITYDSINDTCTEIPVDYDPLEQSYSTVSFEDALKDNDMLKNMIQESAGALAIERTDYKIGENTVVTIRVRPNQPGIENVVLIEHLVKDCLREIKEDEFHAQPPPYHIIFDPLIVWRFQGAVTSEQTVTYTVEGEDLTDCGDLATTLGLINVDTPLEMNELNTGLEDVVQNFRDTDN